MKHTLIALAILISLLTLTLQPSADVTANTSACGIAAEITGPGNTSAYVTARDETSGQVWVLSQVYPGYYGVNYVNCSRFYTITACASSSSGSATHVQYNSVGYITMNNGACIPD